jgi:superfamily II DNA or RNA helicase
VLDLDANVAENAVPVKRGATLRPYQLTAIEAVRALIRAGKKRILLVCPTGSGKTLTAASMLAGALARGNRSLFAAHRKELIDQTVRTFARLGITDVGVIRAQDPRRNESAPIQIASIQTLARRAKPRQIAVIFIDEAHRAMADSYRKHLFEAFPDAIIIGLTATPCRADGRPLGVREVLSAPAEVCTGRGAVGGSGFQELIIGARYSELIAEGFIEEPVVYSTPVLPDLSRVKTTGGDYNQEQLEEAVNRSAIIGDVVRNWQSHAAGRRTVVFAVTIEHSLSLLAAFTAAGVRAEHLDGTTPESEREAILARLESGATTVVCNVGVLTEGWDQPSCKCIVLARPTKSLALYMQMGGRSLRPWRDETGQRVRPIILDHGGCVDRHGFPHEDREWSLTARQKKGSTMPTKMCGTCFAMIPAGCKECPHCSAETAPVEALRDEIEVIDGVELMLRTMTGEDAQLAFYRKCVAKARELGLKPGWVFHRFKEQFGADPPWVWSRALRQAAAKDAVWTEGMARRAARSGEELPRET